MSKQFFGNEWENFFDDDEAKPKQKQKAKAEYILVDNGKKMKLVRVVKIRGKKN